MRIIKLKKQFSANTQIFSTLFAFLFLIFGACNETSEESEQPKERRTKVIIESPMYENPWWLYGGARRN
ncbi:MAG: hypothetical protein WD577_07800 [Bacteroidales bacterium]